MQATLHRDHERFQDLRHDVLGRHEVDVVAAGVLQIEHDFCELAGTYLGAFAELARLEILTKDTAQIAPAEKNRARSVPAAQTVFFAKMRKRASLPLLQTPVLLLNRSISQSRGQTRHERSASIASAACC